jgi:hypothetical protein
LAACIHVDREGNVWVTDARAPSSNEFKNFPGEDKKGSVVVKFSPEGKILMTLGSPGVRGNPPEALTDPTDVVTDPANGDIYVAESHTDVADPNLVGRISVFDKTGKFLRVIGKAGTGPGEFRLAERNPYRKSEGRESDGVYSASHGAKFSGRRHGGRHRHRRRRQHLYSESTTKGRDEIRQEVQPSVTAVSPGAERASTAGPADIPAKRCINPLLDGGNLSGVIDLALSPGDKLGPYEILVLIGKGAWVRCIAPMTTASIAT